MTAANRYANALFGLAAEAKQQAAVTAAVAALAPALADSSIAAALANPRLTPAQRSAFAGSIARSVKAPSSLSGTLGLLAANNRLALLPAVLAAYRLLDDAASGTTHVKVASAAPLTDAQRKKFTDMVKKHTNATAIRLEETVDASLKGGFRAFFNGLVWDASLSGQLARLATSLRNAVVQRQH